MASRAFSFSIPKPNDSFSIGTPQKDMFTDLTAKYGTATSGGGETVTDIIQYNFGTGAATSVEIKFDRGFARQTQNRVLIANFGDGYEQRVRDGINPKVETFNMNLANRRWEEIALISSFVDSTSPGHFNITLELETIKVVCDTYSVNIGHDAVQSISMQLRRVY